MWRRNTQSRTSCCRKYWRSGTRRLCTKNRRKQRRDWRHLAERKCCACEQRLWPCTEKKKKAGDDAVEEEPSGDREEVDASEGGGKRRRLDLNKIINRRLQQKDEELELRRKELELAQEKRKEEAEERKLFMAMMKKQAGL